MPDVVNEEDLAVYFLQQIPDAHDTPEMRRVIVAWKRQESGHNIVRNNPWNITVGADVAGHVGNEGGFAVYGSLALGAQATAKLLLSAGPTDWRGYQAIVAAIRSGDATYLIQHALSQSAWDAGHYGTLSGGPNHLVATYDAFKTYAIDTVSPGPVGFAIPEATPAPAPAPVSDPTEAVVPITSVVTPLDGGNRHGTVPDGTRRFDAESPFTEIDSPAGGGYIFDATVIVDNPGHTPHGDFTRTTTEPPFIVASADVTLDPVVAPEPAPEPVATGPTYITPTYPPSPNAADLLDTWWEYVHNPNLTEGDVAALDAAWAGPDMVGKSLTNAEVATILGPDLFKLAVWDGRFGPPGTPGTESYDFSGFTGLTVSTSGRTNAPYWTIIWQNGQAVGVYSGDIRHYDEYGYPTGFLAASQGKTIAWE